jgi:N utilization substance protein A
MSNPLQQTIEALAKEKGIEPDVVISAIEEAVATASRKYYKTGENLKTRFNTETGQVDLFALKTVVEDVTTPATEISINEAREMYRPLYGDEVANSIELGDEMEFPKPTEVLGRIAAQTAKQVIFQKVREAEREHVFAEYNERIGEVTNGTVKRFENGDIILEIGRIEAVLPRKEQSRAESYTPGDRVRTVIKGVNRSAKGPQIVLSRTDPALLIKLFEQEVPEIYDGTVMIRGAVREAGDRAKVAVYSRERDVDPVGACVGMKGTRVQSIIRELRGEKIDIVEWSDDPIAFVTNGLSPAKVQRVSIVDDGERVMEVIVEDKQLSLAIGKKGQNVRLAAKLTGWRIDIKSEEEKRREVEAQFGELEIPGEPSADLSPEAGDGEAASAKGEADQGADESAHADADAEAGEASESSAKADAAAETEDASETESGDAIAEPPASDVPVPYTLAGIGEKTVRRLVEGGFTTIESLAGATPAALSALPGIGGKTAEKILAAAHGEAPADDTQQE